MQAEERRAKLEAYLQKAEFASLEELAQHVGASVSTVRRDLAALEAGSTIRRTHGGARTLQPPKSDEFVFNVRDTRQVAEKEQLGEACAALIQPGVLRAEKLVNLARHDYSLEPNVTFTPDGQWIVFRSNMFGPTHVFAVEVKGSRK